MYFIQYFSTSELNELFADMSGKGLEEGYHCNMMLICANYLAIRRLVGQHKE